MHKQLTDVNEKGNKKEMKISAGETERKILTEIGYAQFHIRD